MKTNDAVSEIKKKVKNINTDEEVEEICDMLDGLGGRFVHKNPQIDGTAAKIAEEGMMERMEVIQDSSFTPQIGGGTVSHPTAPIRCEITFVADPRDIYDD